MKPRGRGRDLMKVAAAVVGSAAAAQVVQRCPFGASCHVTMPGCAYDPELRHGCASPPPPSRPQLKCSPETLDAARRVITELGGVNVWHGLIYGRMFPVDVDAFNPIAKTNDALEYLELTGEIRREGDAYTVVGCCLYHDADAEDVQCCDDCPNDAGDPESVDAGRGPAHAAMDVHQALNTYEVAADVPQSAEEVQPGTMLVVGENHRKLIARRQDEGVWIGGCLITDPAVAEALAAFITREAD